MEQPSGDRKWRNVPFLVAAVVFVVVATMCIGAAYVLAGWPTSEPGRWDDRLGLVEDVGVVVAAVLALALAYWRGYSGDRQASAARDQVNMALRQVETAQQHSLASFETLRNERYQKSAEMLGSDVMAVRLAGMYTLVQLAHDYPRRYYIQIMKLLCAFARHPPNLHGTDQGEDGSIRQDVFETVTWIGRNRDHSLEAESDYIPNLTGADLRNARLFSVHFSRTTLTDAVMMNTELIHADLSDAHLWGANLSDAKLRSAALSYARLRNAILAGADLTDAHMERAVLINTNLSDHAEGRTSNGPTNLSGANLQHAFLA